MHGDTVVVRLLHGSIKRRRQADNDDDSDDSDDDNVEDKRAMNKPPAGRVVFVEAPSAVAQRVVLEGRIDRRGALGGGHYGDVRFVPSDRKMPFVLVSEDQFPSNALMLLRHPANANEVLRVRLDEWPRTSKSPTGEIEPPIDAVQMRRWQSRVGDDILLDDNDHSAAAAAGAGGGGAAGAGGGCVVHCCVVVVVLTLVTFVRCCWSSGSCCVPSSSCADWGGAQL
eukprot:TRINITY_DN66623_c5_g7_i1.p1 TRINITY_DN66623_c5_g7~~TRINITY_DN66623_c5_g7_i1.p1  ORF type:complete len:238 (-),score=125.29 TRINITY_DN66623_c5_g7_i1:95-772(-)